MGKHHPFVNATLPSGAFFLSHMAFELTTCVCVCVRVCRISSEDSGEVASYNEDSDDSDLEFQSKVNQTGQMNLLEEILDSLSTSNIEQGRLSAAKSLDFFRSIEDLDYNPTVRDFIYIMPLFLFIFCFCFFYDKFIYLLMIFI